MLSTNLGAPWKCTPELFEKLQEITCQHVPAIYPHTEVNKLRYELFCARRGEVESSQLPPCEDCPSCMHYVQTTRLRSGGEAAETAFVATPNRLRLDDR
ncbi:hypothetical protein GWK47_019618 [Chionoecetes opilio]|uniref:Uncharacterized protein n=1 Tax=Chionoecetes opilio TaxID=41210 RepID=A0A8J4XPS5_CHIOP|nr:hypothetical protein GWK47_019618 [Chionoecetes opilio]